MPAISTLGDTSAGHGCFPPTPAISGCSSTVFVNGKPIVLLGAQFAPHTCGRVTHAGALRQVIAGSGTVIVEGKPLARIGDGIADGDAIGVGSGNVFAG